MSRLLTSAIFCTFLASSGIALAQSTDSATTTSNGVSATAPLGSNTQGLPGNTSNGMSAGVGTSTTGSVNGTPSTDTTGTMSNNANSGTMSGGGTAGTTTGTSGSMSNGSTSGTMNGNSSK